MKSPSSLQVNLASWQSKSGLDLNSLLYSQNPSAVTLPGDTESLSQKIQNQEVMSPSTIQAYFTLLTQ
jgi:hypothetical protein